MSHRVAVRYVVALLVMICPSATIVSQESADPHEEPDSIKQAADIEAGGILVGIFCSTCHGIDGSGGRGPDLLGGPLRHGSSDTAIFRNIQSGISGTGMTAFRLPDAEAWQVIRYIQARRRGVTAVELPGDAVRGSQLFEKHNCTTCHWTGSSGRRLGPDLTRSRGSLQYTRKALLEPNAEIDAKYEQVVLIRNSGRVLQGLRLNENTYHMQLIDSQENLHTVSVADVEELHRPKASTMPSYRDQLTDAEVDDLIKYLFSLRELP